ncbi:MAG TPA: hypothetical protein VGL36_35775 [Kribbella sp.]
MSDINNAESVPASKGRARTRAIRAEMAATGESWTTAARNHDKTTAALPATDSLDDAGREDRLPYRVVDGDNQGWLGGDDPETGSRYSADYGWERDLPDRTYPELVASRGPLRPVLPITRADSEQLRELFAAAGRRAVTTLAAALEQVVHTLRAGRRGTAGTVGGADWEYARRTLTAGREGSWESVALIQVVLFGNSLNLAKPSRATGLSNNGDDLRAAGPSKRVDPDVRAALAEMLTGWVTGPARYTEVAETLAAEVSRYCDDTAGPDGWRAVADQWLQPGGRAVTDFRRCYHLLYSQSEHLDTGLL